MRRIRWAALTALTAAGGLLFQSGCLSAFWQGFAGKGFPTDNRWINLALDIANEVMLG